MTFDMFCDGISIQNGGRFSDSLLLGGLAQEHSLALILGFSFLCRYLMYCVRPRRMLLGLVCAEAAGHDQGRGF